ncbi:hypothetical protein [Glycomyces paridis]|uniref:Uncharacterized protein n=1 Tax=Glycomyces paridis TaxID=2126555 RepID=A0A4S8PHY7_9ACTN|nr:hypothetical protein [Glycomyces paridis]THV30213.1 hypothetical protein E9998_07530 [Glycomyces paridis]
MKPEELHRRHLAALITGDAAETERVRRWFKPLDHATAAMYLRAAVAASLEYRFGPGAGLGAGPIDYDELAAFTAEIRRSSDTAEPPPDHLAIESVVRALYGEPHLLEPLAEHQRAATHHVLLRKQIEARPWLGANPGHLIDRAKTTMTAWVLG